MDLNIISYNCRSLSNNYEIIRMLLKQCDILFLQETLILQSDFHLIGSLDCNFDFIAEEAYRKKECFTGRPSGGLVILWNKSLSPFIEPFSCSKRILGLKIIANNKIHILLNVYLPCDYRNIESLLNYRETLAVLHDTINSSNADALVIAGDMNADKYKSRFYIDLSNFVKMLSLNIVDILYLPIDSFSYISSNEYCSTSWLDHIISSDTNIINNIKILYDISFSDHIPIKFTLKLDLNISIINNNNNINSVKYLVLWDKISSADIEIYNNHLDFYLNSYCNEAIMCSNNNCSDPNHKQLLDEAYEYLTKSMDYSCDHMKKAVGNKKYSHIPGWNEYCKEYYLISRNKFIEWKENGRIRSGELFNEMKNARKNFKNSLKFCKNNELKIKKENILKSRNNCNQKEFWKNIKNVTKKTSSNHYSSMDGKNCPYDVVNVFSNKYEKTFNNENLQSFPRDFDDNLNDLNESNTYNARISLSSIDEAINNLKPNLGWDSIHSNHFKISGYNCRNFIRRLINSFLRHNYVSNDILHGQIRPII